MNISTVVNRALRPLGVRLTRASNSRFAAYRPFMDAEDPVDIEPEFWRLFQLAKPFSMVSVERFYALFQAMEHVVCNRIPGAFVECGVWRGGSALFAARMLSERGESMRDFYLYDTFEGMIAPTEHDIEASTGQHAASLFEQRKRHNGSGSEWCDASLSDVRATMALSEYPDVRIHYVEGKVEETLLTTKPDRIALLRLDTDWYESTRAELDHLFPLVSPGGVIIIDDYGCWQGARKAVDEFIQTLDYTPLLQRIDSTGRMFIKLR